MALQVARGLRERGHAIETWFLYKENPAYEDERHVKVILPRKARNILDYVRIFFHLVKKMRRFEPDAVLGILPLGSVFGTLAGIFVGCRSRVASQRNPSREQRPTMRWLDMILGTTKVYSGNLVVSGAVRDTYQHYPRPYRRKMTVVWNGVASLDQGPPKAQARRRLGLPLDECILGNVGRLVVQKNQDFLFEVLLNFPETHLALAGDGGLRAEYEQRIKSLALQPRVRLLGSVPVSDIPTFLSAIDIFVFPSRYEGLPNAVLEALSTGLPVVASDIPPVREILFPEGAEPAGLVAGLDDTESWIVALRRLIESPAEREKLSHAARRRARDFSVSKMVDGYEEVLLSPLENAG